MVRKPNNKTLSKKRIEAVFNEALENIENGKKPNVSNLMRKHGYSDTSARTLKVKETDHWQRLINETMPKSKLFELIARNAQQESDKGASNKALEMLAKIYGDIFPKDEEQLDQGDIQIVVKRTGED